MKEKVSIIIPIYNAEKFLKKCIDSVIQQDYNNIEIILINDGSTDNSEDVCKNYFKNDKVKYFLKKNEGVSKARNLGIKNATGKYITFVDADDYVEKNYISTLVSCIQKDHYDLAICNYYENDDINIHEIIDRKDAFISIMNKKLYKGFLWNKLYKLKIIKDNFLKFNESVHVCEDLLFNYQYIDNCDKNFIFTPEKLYHYVQHDGSALHKKLSLKYLSIVDSYKEIEKILIKNNIDLKEFLISYLKILTDLIYRNSLLKDKLNLENVIIERKKCYDEIKKIKIGLKRKIEIYLYYKYPILIGKMRSLKK